MTSATFETGISDFHKLTTTIMKKKFEKGHPRTLFYRDYKKFDNDIFIKKLNETINSKKNLDFSAFHKRFQEVLNKCAPMKKKMLRYNDNPFMNRELKKSIMLRSRLKNKLNKHKSLINLLNYKKQRNFCEKLLRKRKKEYFSNLDLKKLKDNISFWKTIKPFFSDKGYNTNNIILKENHKIVTNETQISNIMNDYFVNISSNLNINPDKINPKENADDIIDIFKNHHSIQRIKVSNQLENNSFDFKIISEEELRLEIKNLSCKKATNKGDIPANILKNSCDFYLKDLTTIINNCIRDGIFPNELKLADVNPIFRYNKILRLEDLITLKNILFVYDFLKGSLPACFDNYFAKVSDIHNINTRHSELGCLFTPHRSTTRYGLQSITRKCVDS